MKVGIGVCRLDLGCAVWNSYDRRNTHEKVWLETIRENNVLK